MTADKQLKAYIDRVLRLKEEQDTLGDDIREVYAEAKNEGYDKTIMGKLVAHLRKVAKSGEDAVSEQADIFDTYLTAYHRASGTAVATHTHEENYDRQTGEVLDTNPRLIKQVVDGMQTEAGRAALIAAVDIMIDREEAEEQDQPETANETPKQVYGDSGAEATALPSQSVNIPAGGDQGQKIDGSDDRCPAEFIQPETANQASNGSNADRPSLAARGDEESAVSYSPIAPASHGEAEAPSLTAADQPQAGGDDVENDLNAATNQAGGVSATPAIKTAKDYRTHCLKPEACAASGLDHCYSCKRAMAESEAA